MRTITCPDCGITWTCPDSCYPGCHAIDPACEGPEYCRKCGGIRLGIPYTQEEIAKLKNWHSVYEPVKPEPRQLKLGL
jgi:hypothetical protein